MQKLKVKHLFFALGHGERTDFMQGFCGEYDPEGVEIVRKTVRFSLATCPFFPVDLLKNECGAWLKIRWVEGFLFASLSFPATAHRKKKKSVRDVGVVGNVTGGKNRSPGGPLPVPDFRR